MITSGDCVDRPPRNTSKATLPEVCVLRRSTFNRAKLFVPSAESFEERRCSNSITQHVQSTSRYHSMVALNNRTTADFAKTHLHCWHDAAPFDGPVFPIPKSFDATERCFVVFGCFCSLACAKAFLLEGVGFDVSTQLILLERMAREVYGIEDFGTAPPRLSLDIYGGPYSLARFRALSTEGCIATIVTPPFISSYMVVEERDGEMTKVSSMGLNGISTVHGLRRPAKPITLVTDVAPEHCPYTEFLKTKDASAPPPAKTRSKGGTLAKFMK